MTITYEEYLQTRKSLSFEMMQEIHQQMISEIGGDWEAKELYGELIVVSTRYAYFRAEWLLWDKKKKMEQDSSRTSCHNALIVKFNMLSRYLKMHGKETHWRDALGYEEDDRYNRKKMGDFACYLVFVNSLNSR